MLELKGYITNLGKYNEGELVGKWVSFPIDDEELKEVFDEIGINEYYEEYFFTDWDCEIDVTFGEYTSIKTVNEYAEKLQEWNDEILSAACEIWNLEEVLETDPDCYMLVDDVHNNYDLGYYYAVEVGCIDFGKNEILERYFDFEAYGRDISFKINGGFTKYGFIEYLG